MRYYYLTPILALTIALGCKKSSSSNTGSTAPTFQFTVNDTIYHMNGNGATSSLGAKFVQIIGADCTGKVDTVYSLEAIDSAGDDFSASTPPVSSLSATTYTNSFAVISTGPNSGCVNGSGSVRIVSRESVTYWDVWYWVGLPGDYTTIVITNIHGGMVDGTFSAYLVTNGGGPNTLTITDGQFKNVPIVN